MADERTVQRIEHGKRTRAMLAQPSSRPLSLALEVAAIVALGTDEIDRLPIDRVAEFRGRLGDWLATPGAGLAHQIDSGAALNADARSTLVAAMQYLIAEMAPPVAAP